jgi:hypothetical protein
MALKGLKQDICAINWHFHKPPFSMFEVQIMKRQNTLKLVFIHPLLRIQMHTPVGSELLLHPSELIFLAYGQSTRPRKKS